MRTPLTTALAGLALLLAAGAAAVPRAPAPSAASARAFAIRVVVPSQSGAATPEIVSPPGAQQSLGGFAYPADGSVVSTGPITGSVASSTAAYSARARSTVEISSISLFRGELTVSDVTATSSVDVRNGKADGDLAGTAVSGLTALSQGYEAVPGLRVPLADWGYAITLAQGAQPTADGHRGFVTALEVTLTLEHAGLPAGTLIQIGYADASARAAPAPPPTTTRKATTTAPKTTTATTTAPEEPGSHPPPEVLNPPSGRGAEAHGGRLRLPDLRACRLLEHVRIPRARASAGTTVRTSSRRSARPSSRSRAARSSRSGGTTSAATACGSATPRGTSSTTRTSRRTRPLAVDGAHVEAGDVVGFVGRTVTPSTRRRISTSRSTRSDCCRSATTASSSRTSSSARGSASTTFVSPPARRGSRRSPSPATRPRRARSCSARPTSPASGLQPGALESALERAPNGRP